MKDKAMLRSAAFVAILAATTPVFAIEEPVISGLTPANPLFLASVPDTALAWKTLTATPLGGAMWAYYKSSRTPRQQEFDKRLAVIEKEMGIGLNPEAFFTKTINAMDAYGVERGGRFSLILSFRFADPDQPALILERLKRDSGTASGMSGGFSAETVDDKVVGRVRLLSIPAFDLYVAARGDVLMYGSHKAMVETAVVDEGSALFASEYYIRHMEGLSDEKYLLWGFSDFQRLTPELRKMFPGSSTTGLGYFGNGSTSFKLSADNARLRLTTYSPLENMSDAERRYALTAPPAGPLRSLNYIDRHSIYSYATNHFDGLSLIEQSVEAFKDVEGLGLSQELVETRLSDSSAVLGFDPKNDLLAILGPELAISIANVPQDAVQTGTFGGDLLLLVGVKDRALMEENLTTFESVLQNNFAPPANQQPNAASSPRVVKSERVGETDVRTLDVEALRKNAISPSWALTPDNLMLITLQKKTLVSALSIASGGSKESILADSRFDRVAAESGENRHALMMLPLSRLTSLAGLSDAFTGPIASDAKRAEAVQLVKILSLINEVVVSTTYRPKGKKQESMIFFAKSE